MLMSHHHLSNSNAITSSSLHHNNHFQQQQLSSGTVTSTPASCHLQSPFESLIMAGATSSAAAIAPTVTNHVHHGGSNSTNSSSNNSTSSSSTSTSSSSGSSSGSIKDTTFTKIFVGGLPYHTTDASLREHFQVYGEIEEAVVITDRQTGKSRGYGFVSYQSFQLKFQIIPCESREKYFVSPSSFVSFFICFLKWALGVVDTPVTGCHTELLCGCVCLFRPYGASAVPSFSFFIHIFFYS